MVRGMNWTAILAASGLESPGYEEAVKATQELTKEKAALKAQGLGKKKGKAKKK